MPNNLLTQFVKFAVDIKFFAFLVFFANVFGRPKKMVDNTFDFFVYPPSLESCRSVGSVTTQFVLIL